MSMGTELKEWESSGGEQPTYSFAWNLYHFVVNFTLSIYLCSWLCTMCIPGAHGRQKKVSDPLELELEISGGLLCRC